MYDYPFKWVSTQDVRLSSEERDKIYHAGYHQCICCANANFCRKLKFAYVSVEELKACQCFASSVQNFGKRGKSNDMHLERVLAEVKKATPARLPHAERLCAAGLLTQFLTPHLKEGGNDTRITTRKQLLDAGVPLACQWPHGGTKKTKIRALKKNKKQIT